MIKTSEFAFAAVLGLVVSLAFRQFGFDWHAAVGALTFAATAFLLADRRHRKARDAEQESQDRDANAE